MNMNQIKEIIKENNCPKKITCSECVLKILCTVDMKECKISNKKKNAEMLLKLYKIKSFI